MMIVLKMAKLRLVAMDTSIVDFSCGVHSIDEQIKEAYYKTLFKQAVAYNVLYNDTLVGNCMLKLVHLVDSNEDFYCGNPHFTALEISSIAIDEKFQKRGLGTIVLKSLVFRAKKFSDSLPIRYLILDAFMDKEAWYTSAGFSFYPKEEDMRYPGTVPMKMDFIDRDTVERAVSREG